MGICTERKLSHEDHETSANICYFYKTKQRPCISAQIYIISMGLCKDHKHQLKSVISMRLSKPVKEHVYACQQICSSLQQTCRILSGKEHTWIDLYALHNAHISVKQPGGGGGGGEGQGCVCVWGG